MQGPWETPEGEQTGQQRSMKASGKFSKLVKSTCSLTNSYTFVHNVYTTVNLFMLKSNKLLLLYYNPTSSLFKAQNLFVNKRFTLTLRLHTYIDVPTLSGSPKRTTGLLVSADPNDWFNLDHSMTIPHLIVTDATWLCFIQISTQLYSPLCSNLGVVEMITLSLITCLSLLSSEWHRFYSPF